MSDQDKNSSRKLVPTGHRDLARIAAANPLVSRGIDDLTKKEFALITDDHPHQAAREASPPVAESLQALIEKGKQKGFLTYTQLADHLPDDAFSPKKLDQFLEFLEQKGIELIDDSNERRDELSLVKKIELADKMEQVLKTLTYREREIIKLRYGLCDGYTYTLEEVSRIFKVTPERIKEIEAKAVRKLQHPVRHRQLEAFLDILASKGLHLGQSITTEEFSDEENATILANTLPELNLSKRTRMCMHRLGIYSLDDLISRSAEELLEEKKFGETCLTEVRDKLAQLGLTLRGD
jgi:RNA polymerase sigma factor (sigma-70 family)